MGDELLKCPQCEKQNDISAETCRSCGINLEWALLSSGCYVLESNKTREQLIKEVAALRARVMELKDRFPEEFLRNFFHGLASSSATFKLYEHLFRARGPEWLDKYHAGLRHEDASE